MTVLLDSQRIMEHEIGEIIMDIAALDPGSANHPLGPYAGSFDYMRRHLLDAPCEMQLDNPENFVLAIRNSQDTPAALRCFTRAVVVSYLRRQQRQGGQPSHGWWQRLIDAVGVDY